MAAVTAPARTAAQHQSLLHFVGEGGWSDERVLAKVRELVLPAIERHGPIEAWIIDDTGFPKKGRHSVGVARQYCGAARQAGQLSGGGVAVDRQSPRQPAGGLSAVSAARTGRATANVGARPACRRRSVSRPSPRSRWSRLALGLRGRAAARRGADGRRLWHQHAICAPTSRRWDLSYVAGILSTHDGLGAGHGAAAAEEVVGPRTATEADAARRQASAGLGQGACAWPAEASLAHRSNGAKARPSRCPRALRACAFASRIATTGADRQPAGRMAADRMARRARTSRPNTGSRPFPTTSPSDRLVDIAKLRWRIERDYQELKQEVGLGHFEGRGWRGFHHHATLCIAAYGFLISERETIPPSGPRSARLFPQTCRTRGLSTQRLRRCGPNVTSRTRSQPCAAD